MRYIFSLILILSILVSSAQKAPAYHWGINGGGSCISADQYGDVWAMGTFTDSVNFNGRVFKSLGPADMLLTKTDRNGNVKLTKQFSNITGVLPISIVNDKSGNVYISARYLGTVYFDTIFLNSKGGRDLLLLKLDNNANIIWVKTFGGNGEDFGLNNLAIDKDDNICMSAVFSLEDVDTIDIGNKRFIASSRDDIYVMKLNPAGEVLWVNREGGRFDDGSYGIATDGEGNIYNTGWFADVATFGGNTYIAQPGTANGTMYVSKYNSNGQLQYVRQPGSGLNNTGFDIKAGGDGSIFVCGQAYESFTIGSLSVNTTSQTAFVVKYENDGNVSWLRTPDGTTTSTSKQIAIDNRGDIYTTLQTYGNTSLLKYNKEGQLLWSNAKAPHTKPLYVETVCTSINNDVFISGYYNDDNHVIGNNTLPVYAAIINNSYIAKAGSYPASVNDETTSTFSPYIYPNPNNGNFTIRDLPAGEHSYEIINAVGQVVYKGKAIPSMITQKIVSGIYLLKLHTGTSTIAMRFVVQ